MSQIQHQPQDHSLNDNSQVNYIHQSNGYQNQDGNQQQQIDDQQYIQQPQLDFDQQQQFYQDQQQEIDQINQDFNNQNLSPTSQKEYIQFLQNKLKQYENQLQESSQFDQNNQNLDVQQQQQSQNLNYPQFNQSSHKKNTQHFTTGKSQNNQAPQYPKGFEDWIVRQSISPSKNEYFSENKYYQDIKQYTFKPNINQKSLRMSQRLEKQPESYMVKYLYGDALSRFSKISNKQKQIAQNINQESNRSKIGMKSQKIVLKKIEESLSNILNTIEEGEELSFENLGHFFQQLGLFKALQFKKTNQNETSLYLHDREKVDVQRLSQEMQFHEQIWKILINNNPEAKTCQKRLIFEFTMILLEKRLFISQSVNLMEHILKETFQEINVPNTIKQTEQMQQQQIQNQENQQEQQEQENQVIWSLEQLIQEFRKLFEDKTNLMVYYSSQKPILESVNELNNNQNSFQPKINKKSAVIDKNNNGVRKRYDLLYDHSKYLQEKQKEQKELKDQEILDQCTFQPQTNDFNFREYSDAAQTRFDKLYSLQDQWLMKKTQNKTQLDSERARKELEECTFKPKLVSQVPLKTANSYGQIDQKSFLTEVKGSEQVIQRYQKAREEKSQLNSYWEKRQQSWNNHDITRTTEQQPFSFALQSELQKSFRREKQELIGSVDVNYAKGKKSKIVIYKGDSPRKLASSFAKIHSLSEEMKECLVEMLEQYIQGIENSENNDNNDNNDQNIPLDSLQENNRQYQNQNQDQNQDQDQDQDQDQNE